MDQVNTRTRHLHRLPTPARFFMVQLIPKVSLHY